ncbi:response regulator [Paenibacillus psychroresistens]|nr:response regulator [Paenibacillus psychroresistens]
MHKILIVDDEMIFRKYLQKMYPWESYGFELCGEASDGIEALERIEQIVPDIALIDINMPVIDGLQLSQTIKERYPGIAIVLITGHSEFEYAKRAVKIGVEDYILKPFDKNELLTVLIRIKERFDRLKAEKSSEKDYNQFMKERLLNLIISNETTGNDETTKQSLENFGIRVNSLTFCVAVIEIDNMYQKWTTANEIILWKYAVCNIAAEILESEENPILFYGPEGRIIVLFEFKRRHEDKQSGFDCFTRLCTQVKNYLKFSVTVGIGNPIYGISAIRDSYMESLEALQSKVIAGVGRVIRYAEIELEYKNIGFYSSAIHEKLGINLRLRDWEEIKKGLEEVFQFIRDKQLSVDYTNAVIMGLISICLSYLSEHGYEIEDVLGSDFSPGKQLRNKESLDEAFSNVEELYLKVMGFSNKNKFTKSRKLIDSAREYIEINYNDNNLRVEQIAQKLFVTSSYLRKVFKKDLNLTVGDYITDIRMQKAKELLGKGNIRVAAISEMVGFCDATHFSKSFKKRFGLPPSEYENSLK